jgi:hypothetical protein
VQTHTPRFVCAMVVVVSVVVAAHTQTRPHTRTHKQRRTHTHTNVDAIEAFSKYVPKEVVLSLLQQSDGVPTGLGVKLKNVTIFFSVSLPLHPHERIYPDLFAFIFNSKCYSITITTHVLQPLHACHHMHGY